MTMNLTTTYTVNTTNGDNIPAGHVQLSANLRDTDKVKIDAAQRYRNVYIKELSLPQVEDALRPVLLDKLYSLAKERFEATMADSNRMALTVPQDDYTLAGILSYYATDAKSGRMTKESVLDWFNSSETCKYITSKNAAAVEGYRNNYAKAASPNHGINPNTCRALIAAVQEADTTNAICAAIVSRLQATITKSESSAVAAL